MKQITTFMLAAMLLATASAFAQGRNPMLVQGKTWYYTYHHFEDIEEPTGDNYPEDFYDETCYEVSYTVQGDTLIDGREYMKIYRRDDRGRSKYYGAFREDEEGLVWQYDYEGDKKDFMICDYTCLHYPGPWPEVGDIVDVVIISGQLLHRHSWNGMLGVEGVGMAGKGLIHYLFEPEPDCICDYESFSAVVGGGIWFTASDFKAPKYIELTQEEKRLVENNNDFAFRLFQKARGEESSIMSPLSITYALGMMNNGAAGQTQQEINEVLGSVGVGSADAINNFCRKLLTEAPTLDEETTAEIANTIYVNQGRGYELQQGFVDKANEFYDAQPESRNFYDGVTWEVINQWANDHTHGMIPKVFDTEDAFNQDAVSYLLNAIYFKGAWANKFDKANTHDEAFNGGDKVPMMSQMEEFEYTENDLYQAVCLPYGNGAYEMTVFLPREGKTIGDVLSQMDGKNWQMKYAGSYLVNLKLPRMETETGLGLAPIMEELGMPTAFGGAAEFPYFGNRDVFIGDMFQKAKIKLDEEGTEAAAVTVIAAGESMPMVADFHANRPFFYIISERSTSVIFFMGQYLGEGVGTSIREIEDGRMNIEDVIYDLQGRRMDNGQLRKGIYIIDGRKVVR